MAAIPIKLTTGASLNLTLLSNAPALNLTGVIATNTAAYDIFVKFYWFTKNGTNLAPTVGTTVPDITINAKTVNTTSVFPPGGFTGNGDLWVAVTKLAFAADQTNTVALDGIITFFLG